MEALMGAINSIRNGTNDSELHSENMNPDNMNKAAAKGKGGSLAPDGTKVNAAKMEQGNTKHPGDDRIKGGGKPAHLDHLKSHGMGSQGHATNPSKDVGRTTGYD
jgi:hypothetical protein